MTGRERILALLDGKPVDSLPFMPITMMFACDRIGAEYRDYATDCQVLVEGQTQAAAEFDFDYVNVMSDPAGEAADPLSRPSPGVGRSSISPPPGRAGRYRGNSFSIPTATRSSI